MELTRVLSKGHFLSTLLEWGHVAANFPTWTVLALRVILALLILAHSIMLFWRRWYNHFGSQRQTCKMWAPYRDQIRPVLSEPAGVQEWVSTLKAILSAGPVKPRDRLSSLPHPAAKACRAQSRHWWCLSSTPLQLPCSPAVLTATAAGLPDALQGSPLQEGCWERISFSVTFSKSEELLYNRAIQHLLSFNRYNKGYCMLFITLICYNFMLLSKTQSAVRGTSSCLTKIW